MLATGRAMTDVRDDAASIDDASDEAGSDALPPPLPSGKTTKRSRVTVVLPAAVAAPPLPVPPPRASAAAPTPDDAQRTLDRIESLAAEARAAAGAAAAPLWFEAGRLYETELQDFKAAAGLYQEAHKADPQYLPVIHGARRLFGQLGKWGMCVVLIDEELRLPGAPVAELLVEKARILESRLGRAEEAVALYQQAVSADPGSVPALEPLSRHLEARGAWKELADVLRAGAESVRRPEQQLAWLLEAGRISEARLADESAALDIYARAAKVAPGNRTVLESLRRLHARRNDVEELAAILDQLAETAPSLSEAVMFRCERARLLAGAGQETRAVEALEHAREDAATDPLILGELAWIYERLGMWASLLETLEAHARSTRDRTELLLLFSEAGKIADEKLNDPERAVQLYGSCVEVDLHYAPALVALGKLYHRLGKHRELARTYEVQIAAAADPLQKVNLLFKLAEHLHERMNDANGAIARLEELLRVEPGWLPALKLMASLFSKLERWDQLIETYELELATMGAQGRDNRDQVLFLLEKIASVIEEKVGSATQAVAVYRRMLATQPGYMPALRALGRIFARLERWDDLIGINLEETKLVTDQNHVVSLLFKNGELYAEKLGRTDDAIASYQQALAVAPSYLPALMALGAIFSRTGRHLELVAMHRKEAEAARNSAQRAQALYLVAQVYDDHLHDAAEAMAAYRAVLVEDPGYLPALRALARVSSIAGDWPVLVEMYERELAALSEARDRAHLRCRIAEILDRRLGRPDDAVTMLVAAIREAGYLLAAHEQLVALLARLGRIEDEVAAREAMNLVLSDVDSRVANMRVLAEHALYRLNQPDRALEAAQRILAEVPHDRAVLRLVLNSALRLGNHRLAVEIAEKLARVEPSRDEVANLHLQVATWKESHLDPPEDSLPNYIRALEYVPDHPSALRAVERFYVERQAWEALYALYERELQGQTKPDIIADLNMKMGELAERRLGQPNAALACYERVLGAQPDHLPAITRLKDLYGRTGKATDQLRMLTLEAKTSRDSKHVVETLLQVGTVQRDKFGNLEAAVESFLGVLEHDPLHKAAYQGVEGILVTESRWEDLARLYMRRSAAVPEHNQKVELMSKAAHILGERLKRYEAAAEAYEGVIALVPEHTGALLQLGNIRFALKEWEAAAKAYGQLVQVASDPLMLTPVHENLGIIYSEHLEDPGRAVQHLTATLVMQPDNREVRKRLACAHTLAGSPAQALTAYKNLLSTATEPSEKRALHLALARVFEEGMQDLAQAIPQLEQALALGSDAAERKQVLDILASLYERTGNLAGLIQATMSNAEQTAPKDPGMAADLYFRAAQLQLERQEDVEGATRTVRRGLEAAPDNAELRAFLASIYARMPNKTLAIEEHRRILRSGRMRPLSVRALCQMWQETKAFDRALVAAELLVFLGVANDAEQAVYNEYKKRVRKESRETIEPQQLKSWVVHQAQRNVVHDILVLVAPELAKPFTDAAIEPVDKKLILKPKTDDPLRRLADEVGHNFGVAGFDIHQSERRRSLVRAYTAAPMVVSVGVDAAATLQTSRDLRFMLGREVVAMACGHTLIRGLDGPGLGGFLSALGRSIDKSFPMLGDAPDFDDQMRKMGAALSRKTRAALAEPLATLVRARIDLQAFVDAVPMTETRGGLLVSGSFAGVARLIAKEVHKTLTVEAHTLPPLLDSDARLADLAVWSLTDEHFLARQALRFAVEGG